MLKKKKKKDGWPERIPDKNSSLEELLKYANSKYPIGTRIRYPKEFIFDIGREYVIASKIYRWNEQEIDISLAGADTGCIVYTRDGYWAEIID